MPPETSTRPDHDVVDLLVGALSVANLALARVRRLHRANATLVPAADFRVVVEVGNCETCGQEWPCATYKAASIEDD